jgi:hypothetical protein
MKMKPSMIFAVVLVLLAQLAYSQNFSKTGVLKMSLRNSGAILQDNQVKGYYFFYNLEKKDRKNNNYLLSVYDENLREINSVNIVRPVNYLLVDGAFNGDAFGFLFYDTRNSVIELIAYDQTLKEAGAVRRELKSKSTQSSFGAIAMGQQTASQAYLVPVSHKGFLYYGLKDGNKAHYQTEFYDNTMKQVWSVTAPQTAQNIETASEAFQSDLYIGSLILKKKNQASKDIDTELMVQQVEDGKTLFKIPMETKEYSISYSDVYFDAAKQNFVVFGEYYNLKDKELKSQSLGFIYLTVDVTGKIVDEKINSWEKEISRVTPLNEKGKFVGSNTNVLVHDIIRTSDGQIFVVGEQYKKAASAAGIASNILGVAAAAAGGGIYSSASNVQLNVYNLVVFQFNPDYTINKLHIFEKDKNVVSLPSGAGYASSKLLSYYAKAVGGFDFTFSQVASDKNTFIVTYINYDREKGEKAKNLLGAVVYTPEKIFSVDKMALNRKSTEYLVYRAKEGYVLITEYFKKEKRIDTRLEKINF